MPYFLEMKMVHRLDTMNVNPNCVIVRQISDWHGVETGASPLKLFIGSYSCSHNNAIRSWNIILFLSPTIYLVFLFAIQSVDTSVLKILLGGVFIFPLYSVGDITSVLSPIFQIIAFMVYYYWNS